MTYMCIAILIICALVTPSHADSAAGCYPPACRLRTATEIVSFENKHFVCSARALLFFFFIIIVMCIPSFEHPEAVRSRKPRRETCPTFNNRIRLLRENIDETVCAVTIVSA